MVAVGSFTLAMGLTRSLPWWIAFRLLAGMASAFVLVGVSAWAMPILSRRDKQQWSGRIFAGVGIGIAVAGLIGLAAGVAAWGSQATWIILGVIACALAVPLWISLVPDGNLATPGKPGKLSSSAWIAAGCYGAFGYGYIIPATFLPVLARGTINKPVIFGWIWPVFGLAAAISTLAAVKFLNRLSPRRLWIGAQWVLAAGVTAPVLAVNVTTLLIAAVCVGGSFMVITMAGIKEALRLGGEHSTRAVGMMTAGFGIGQIAGPLIVGWFAGSNSSFVVPSLIAVIALIASNVALYAVDDRAPISADQL
jgi:MFS family permease